MTLPPPEEGEDGEKYCITQRQKFLVGSTLELGTWTQILVCKMKWNEIKNQIINLNNSSLQKKVVGSLST